MRDPLTRSRRLEAFEFRPQSLGKTEKIWRRVGESNSCARICNPSHPSEPIGQSGKRTPFVHDEQSSTYEAEVNENPGALAGATGAEGFTKDEVAQPYTGATGRAISALLEAAEAGDADACTMAIRVLRRLPGLQVATIAAVALGALHDDDAELVVASVIRRAGWPLHDELTPLHSARLWAADAGRGEKKAYCLAAYERMHPADRAAFVAYVSGRVAA